MSVSISERVRRLAGIAVGNRDAAGAFCDDVETSSGVANGQSLYLYVPISDLAAGADIANLPLISFDVAATLESVALLAHGAFAGIDASNTMVVAVKDQAGNTIVTKTFDDQTVPDDYGHHDLGTLNGTHKVLNANEAATISITNGVTADPPLLSVLLAFHVT